MIIGNDSNNPQFSTDGVAHDVSRFVARRQTIPIYDAAEKAKAAPQDPKESAVAKVGRNGKAAAIFALALSLGAVSATPARASENLYYGDGSGYDQTSDGAYKLAFDEAENALVSQCWSGDMSDPDIVDTHSLFDGREYRVTVRLKTYCV